MAKVTEQDVVQAEQKLRDAKGASHASPNSEAKRQQYRDAANHLSSVRVAFRQQEEDAGRRVGFVTGDAEMGGNG